MKSLSYRLLCVFLLGVLIVGAISPAVHADRYQPPPADPSAWPRPYVPPLTPPPARAVGLRTTVTAAIEATEAQTAISNPVLDMKVLVLYTPGDADGVYASLRAYLEILGIPYTPITVAQPGPTDAIQPDDLWDGVNHGYYYAIFTTTSNVWYALSPAAQTALLAYEQTFNVRSVTWYTFPAPDFGLSWTGQVVSEGCGGAGVNYPLTVNYTSAGQQVFSYLNTALPLTLEGYCLYGYLAQPAPGETVTPLLTDTAGNTILALHQAADGREQMALTLGSFYPAIPPAYIHARILPYGIINWATRGLFLGERHLYFSPQTDDVLAWGDRWDAVNHQFIYDNGYRLQPDDLDHLVAWINTFRSQPNAAAFHIEFPFNGDGTEDDMIGGQPLGSVIPGTLTAKAVQLQAHFTWLNHTYTHRDLDIDAPPPAGPGYNVIYTEILSNTQLAAHLGFTDYSTQTLLTGDYSGIGQAYPLPDLPPNPDLAQAAYDLGVRYMLANASIPAFNNPSPNTGIPHPSQPDILLVPRYANNIFYAVTTPEEETDLYNVLYCPGYAQDPNNTPRCYDYDDILNNVTDQALAFLLDYSINPTMFHMNNLDHYSNGRTLVADFTETLYAKYNALFANNVPILSLRTQDIGLKMRQRMAYNASGVAGQLTCGNQITLSTQNAAIVPLTGVNYGDNVETYAAQPISYLPMDANQTLVIPGAPASIPAAITGLTATRNGNDIILAWPALTQDTQGNPLQAAAYRVYARANDPYFTPTPSDLLAEVTDITFTHSGAANDPTHNYTYVVTAIGDNCWRRESEPSNRVGEFDFSVEQGRYNHLALPLAQTGVSNAQEAVSHITTQVGAPPSQALKWDATIGAFLVYEPGNPFSQNFSLNVGDSFFVLLGGAGPAYVNFTGAVPTAGSYQANLLGGSGGSCFYNDMSLPLEKGEITNASGLAAAIGDVSQVLQWNAAADPSGMFQVYEPGNPFSQDFPVAIGHPYLVCMTASKLWP